MLIKGKLFQIIMCYVCVFVITRIVADFLLLPFQCLNEHVKLLFSFLELPLLLVYLCVFFPSHGRHEVYWIRQLRKRVAHTFLRTACCVFSPKRLGPRAFPPVDSSGSVPTNVVLSLLCDEPNALKNIGDVIDPPLLDIEEFDCFVQIQCLVRGFLK